MLAVAIRCQCLRPERRNPGPRSSVDPGGGSAGVAVRRGRGDHEQRGIRRERDRDDAAGGGARGGRGGRAPRKTARAGHGDAAPLKLEEFLPYRLNVVASLVSQALSRVYAERYGIGVPEWRVLVTLGQFGLMTGKAIGQHSHMHKTKVSRAVALLEKRKLLTRRANRADLREAFLALTPTGRAMYDDLAPIALDFARSEE